MDRLLDPPINEKIKCMLNMQQEYSIISASKRQVINETNIP